MSLLREPLLHFAVLGAVLFTASAWGDRPEHVIANRIVVTQSQIDQRAAEFSRRYRREPSAAERQMLIDEHIRTEVAYREALALDLDRDDPVIRQRLREKIEFLFDDVGGLAEPTDAQLEEYLRQHPETFRTPSRVTFEQRYLDPRHRSTADAADLVARLNRGENDAATVGDPFLLEPRHDGAAADEVAALFGERFAGALDAVPIGDWHGPIESSYGLHLVRVRQRTPATLPSLSDVRDAVRVEWMNAHRQRTKDRLYDELVARYAVTVEPPNR